MLGLGRCGLRKLASRRAYSTAVQASASQTVSSPPADVQKASFNKNKNRSFAAFTPIEQIKLQKKYQENLQNNKVETLHDAIEYIEWRGTVYPQFVEKVVKLLENSNELTSLSDRQLAVILTAFGSSCDTISRSARSKYVAKVEQVLKAKGVQLGLQSRNAIIECKLDNRSPLNSVEEIQQFEDAGIVMDSKSYALMCEIYAKQGNTKAVTDIIAHMKSNGIPLLEDHVAQLVYSIARSGKDSQISKVIEAFSNTMNIVRLRCSAARAIIQREINEPGKGAYEVTEILRAIPTTARIQTLENNIYIVNVLMDLIEAGQLDAFNLLSGYLIVDESTNTLADNQLNVTVVAKSKSILNEGNLSEALALYSCVHPNYANEFFVGKLKQSFGEELKNINDNNFDSFVKILKQAENKGLIANTDHFLLAQSTLKLNHGFRKVFEHVKNSGNLRKILSQNPELKKPIAKQLGHYLISSTSEEEKVNHLANIAIVMFAFSKKESGADIRSYYPLVYKIGGNDVKLVLSALDLIAEIQEKREYATSIVSELLRTIKSDHLAVEKLSKLLESNKVPFLNSNRVHRDLTHYLISEKNDKERLKIVAKILTLDFPPENMKISRNFAAKNLATFLSNELVTNEVATALVKLMEEEPRVALSVEEMKEAKKILQSSPEKVELIGRLKKSQTMTRWRSSTVEELLVELALFNEENTRPAVTNALKCVIIQTSLSKKSDDIDFLAKLVEQASEWKKEGDIGHNYKQLIVRTLAKAISSNNMVLADRVWILKPGHLYADITLSYASKLFLDGQVDRANEVCEDLRNSAQVIRPATLEKMTRLLTGVSIDEMSKLASYLGKQFNLAKKDVGRIVLQAKLEKLNGLIKKGDLAEAIQMAVQETKSSGRAFGQVPLMVEAIKANDSKALESVHLMVRSVHGQDIANVNLAYSLIQSDFSQQAKQLVDKQNLVVEDRTLQYFITLASATKNHAVLKNLFIVFNGRASTVLLNTLLEVSTKALWTVGDIGGLNELKTEIESTSFPLQFKLRQFFDNLNNDKSGADFD